jgi:hypothetical protein
MFNIFYGGAPMNRASDRPRRLRRNCNCYPKDAQGNPMLDQTPIQLNDCLMGVPCPTCCANRVGANYTGVDVRTRYGGRI